MSVANFERGTFGEPLTNDARILAGVMAVIGAAAHVGLTLATALFFYVLVAGP